MGSPERDRVWQAEWLAGVYDDEDLDDETEANEDLAYEQWKDEQ